MLTEADSAIAECRTFASGKTLDAGWGNPKATGRRHPVAGMSTPKVFEISPKVNKIINTKKFLRL